MARGSVSKNYQVVSPLLSSHDITCLLQPVAQCISDEYPWVSNDEAVCGPSRSDVESHSCTAR